MLFRKHHKVVFMDHQAGFTDVAYGVQAFILIVVVLQEHDNLVHVLKLPLRLHRLEVDAVLIHKVFKALHVNVIQDSPDVKTEFLQGSLVNKTILVLPVLIGAFVYQFLVVVDLHSTVRQNASATFTDS